MIPANQRELKHQRLWFLPAPDSDKIPEAGFFTCLVLGKRGHTPAAHRSGHPDHHRGATDFDCRSGSGSLQETGETRHGQRVPAEGRGFHRCPEGEEHGSGGEQSPLRAANRTSRLREWRSGRLPMVSVWHRHPQFLSGNPVVELPAGRSPIRRFTRRLTPRN